VTARTKTIRDKNLRDKRERKKNTGLNGVLVLVTFMGFVLVFTYMSLNLKNIDFGYEMQELLAKERTLKEEIDKLKSKKAQLLNLKRVEQLVIEKLGYQYPEPEQFIKVYVD
jgi:cell division protein FtsL